MSRPTQYWPSKRVWAVFVFTLVIAMAFPLWDALVNRTPDTHPLQRDRLILRLIGLCAIAANFAIFGIVGYRVGTRATRQRDGLCPECGYDLRASADRCPECGSPKPPPGPPGPIMVPPIACQIRILKLLAVVDHWSMHLIGVIAFGSLAIFFDSPVGRVLFAGMALLSLINLVRRLRRGAGYFDRLLEEVVR